MEASKLLKKQLKAYNTIDTFLEALYKKAKTEKRIEIRGIQRAIRTAVECEYQLALLETN